MMLDDCYGGADEEYENASRTRASYRFCDGLCGRPGCDCYSRTVAGGYIKGGSRWLEVRRISLAS